ncbi:HGxxPAAW family protein [Streptomyces boncukensis]|uniref:Uncharacterized protein n=1 Tax=Streptomyces boncukensis TaxID=2711219 RepID=A0A6G4WZF3_9ACTN|nr:HGxxPAAW family protein [Streptomyces boncukensis]NGO70383.1 hypothetical protein [Streptomyces boncukensis]
MAHSHGHTPAAWTGVIIAFIGFCTGSVFMVVPSPAGVIASLGLIALGAVVGGVMRAMGLGQSHAAGLTKAQLQARKEEAADSAAAASPATATATATAPAAQPQTAEAHS